MPTVQLAADVEAAKNNTQLPNMMLVLGRETVSHGPMSHQARHRVKTEVLLVTGIRRRNQPLGPVATAGDDELAQLRKPALTQLINWMPPGGDIPVKWQRGQLLALQSHALFWADVLTA
ncbi:phage tail terminator protein, partial [Halomonas llamarensis]